MSNWPFQQPPTPILAKGLVCSFSEKFVALPKQSMSGLTDQIQTKIINFR